MKLSRLSGRKNVEHLRRKGQVWRGKHMQVTYQQVSPSSFDGAQDDTKLHVGTFASTKLHKSAVKRNRMRRRCREALRTTLKESDRINELTNKRTNVSLLIAPRSSSLTCEFEELRNDVQNFLKHLSRSS